MSLLQTGHCLPYVSSTGRNGYTKLHIRYCSILTPSLPVKNSVDVLVKSADKTQQESEKADPTGE